MSKTKSGSNAQFTSAGKGLTTIGEHCYAYSGVYKATTDFQEVLSFQTGKYYIKGILQLNSGIDLSSPANRVLNSAKTTFNDITVSFIATGTSTDDSPTSQTEVLLIPPLTLVVVEVDSSATADRDFTVGFVGRIY